MSGCYILYSQHLKRFYIGAIHDDLDSRIKKHNEGTNGITKFTAKATDWQLYLFIACETYAQAICIERHIKRMKSSVYIRNLTMHQEIVDNLKLKCKSVRLPR
ncbi:MAG: GIY-YIG nuclease family protein [Cytophagales bacterium]|nr:GIY-YIG nuclease family protein [Cytophagales bacterium]MCA6386791.1 GIY-YIG nuclease family protein [Cytophagales bacterium]MCA6391658.1 GIY-YIG nuclease family protein [Cytophagales bacterium]MCA6394013.1 GIY-YIG nuclease family protein [Cytophagales bacterium]MCA6399265.1 GIY-YIG nuclease family protein [Cytophagales bacterium]